MSLKNIDLKMSYHSSLNKVAKNFYIPLLREASVYKRAVGFFSSSIFSVIATGITALADNSGQIQLVASPKLSEEDIIAIKQGYLIRDEIVKNAIKRELVTPRNPFEAKNLNILANLIADGIMDIKIALTENEVQAGMFHVKMGLVEDSSGNVVAFTGSMNESLTALELNYESIDVYCSWKTVDEQVRVTDKINQFTSIWNNTEPNVSIVDFPELKQEIIDRYKITAISDYAEEEKEVVKIFEESTVKHWLHTPDNFTGYFDYQRQAMEKWRENGYRGIFDMATGTGKTLTALGALELLCSELNDRIGIIIVCPYQHLIEQWIKDIIAYGVTPIICYSRYDWKKRFKYALGDYSCGAVKNFCVITTNDTLATKYFQEEVDKLRGDVCFVVDEAHNFGAKRQLDCMKEVYTYRLALSATFERRYDEYGTGRLLEFFGEKCIEYTLERAIREDKLTPYYYYPIPVYLETDELAEYNELTEKIIKILLNGKKEARKLPKSAEMLLIKRARIIAAARRKLKALYDIIHKEYHDDDHILVYCGATTVENSSYKEGVVDPDEKRQIEIVIDMLGNDLGMRVSMFTSAEDTRERESIKEDFSNGDLLKVLVAIRCLDEGVNIPGIKTAFILASSTNPKEYIQRRGRVLRKAPNKPFAKIYDFITLPRNLDEPLPHGASLNSEYSLIRREYERMEDFAHLAENTSEVVKLQDEIGAYYQTNYIGGKDYGI
jgi:superfamily II DNA or RNA helicase